MALARDAGLARSGAEHHTQRVWSSRHARSSPQADGSAVAITREGPVVRARWRGMPTALGVAQLRAVLASEPCGVLVHELDLSELSLAQLGALAKLGGPDPHTKEQLKLLGKETDASLRGAAALLRGHPVAVAMARAAILGIRAAAESTAAFEVSSDPAAIARFVAQHAVH